jgi:hypothetical protein
MTEIGRQGTMVASVAERRALDAEEWLLADMTRVPVVRHLDDAQLASLIGQLRERRQRAQAVSDARPAEGPSTGAIPSGRGIRRKQDYLGEALERALAEQARRSAPDDATVPDGAEPMRKAV